MLTVQDIKKRQFSKKLRGYNSDEVDKFKDDILNFIASLKRELGKSHEDVSIKEDELKKSEVSIKELMEKAQEIESAIGQQDEVNEILKEENSNMFKKFEKCVTHLEISKRENSSLETANIGLRENLEAQNKENTQQKETISSLEIQVKKYCSENREYLEAIDEYKEREDSIKEVMLLAKKAADEIINKAEIEGKNIVINAEEQVDLLLKEIKILENRIMKMKRDFSEVVNYHADAFENEINKLGIIEE